MSCASCGTEGELLAGRCRVCGWNPAAVERQCLKCGRIVLLRSAIPFTASIGVGMPAFLAYRVIGKVGVMAVLTFCWAASFFFSALTVRHACSMCGFEVSRDVLTEDEIAEARKERTKMLAIAGASAVGCLVLGAMWLGAAGVGGDAYEEEPEGEE